MFLQISVNAQRVISGAYSNEMTGDNSETIFETSLGTLTLDVSPVAIHFSKTQTQTWLLVRIPEPAPAGEEMKIPEISRKPPTVRTVKTDKEK